MARDAMLNNINLKIASGGFSNIATEIQIDTSEDVTKFALMTPPFDAFVYNSTDYPEGWSDPFKEYIRILTFDSGLKKVTSMTRGQQSTSAANHNLAGKQYRIARTMTVKDLDDLYSLSNTEMLAAVNAEATTRATNDTSEATARAAADTAESSARSSADTTLQTNINAEATTRASADTTLQNNINSEASTRATAITTEATARANADTNLQNQITALSNAAWQSINAVILADTDNVEITVTGGTNLIKCFPAYGENDPSASYPNGELFISSIKQVVGSDVKVKIFKTVPDSFDVNVKLIVTSL